MPKPGRQELLTLFHKGHPSISRMKGLAHSHVWWPNFDVDLQTQVKQCNQCQLNQPSPPAIPTHPWDWPQQPWQWIHLNYAGSFMGKMFFVAIHARTLQMDRSRGSELFYDSSYC